MIALAHRRIARDVAVHEADLDRVNAMNIRLRHPAVVIEPLLQFFVFIYFGKLDFLMINWDFIFLRSKGLNML